MTHTELFLKVLCELAPDDYIVWNSTDWVIIEGHFDIEEIVRVFLERVEDNKSALRPQEAPPAAPSPDVVAALREALIDARQWVAGVKWKINGEPETLAKIDRALAAAEPQRIEAPLQEAAPAPDVVAALRTAALEEAAVLCIDFAEDAEQGRWLAARIRALAAAEPEAAPAPPPDVVAALREALKVARPFVGGYNAKRALAQIDRALAAAEQGGKP